MARGSTSLLILAATIALAVSPLWVASAGDSSSTPGLVPSGGQPLFEGDFADNAFWTPRYDPKLAQTSMIPVRDMPFRQAVSTRTFRPPAEPWSVVIGARLSGAIEKGDVCLLSFTVRGNAAHNGPAQANVFVELKSRPHTKMLRYPVRARDEWLTYYVPFQAKERFLGGTLQVVFHAGFGPQTFEVGGVSMLNFGKTVAFADLPHTPIAYEGREIDARWREQALERIEQIRKAPLTVEAVDSGGTPIEDALVRVRMVRHAFGFGSAVAANLLGVDLEDAEAVRRYFLDYGGSRDVSTYREIAEELFNKAVFENDLKFTPWTESRSNLNSRFRKEWTDRAFDWLHERGMGVRGHWISCGALEDYPREMVRGSRSVFRSRLLANMRDKVPDVGKRVVEWDAVNHLANGQENLAAHFGSPDVYAEIMKLSRELAPGIGLWVNEDILLANSARTDRYEELIRYLIGQDAAPDGIGFMGHFDILSLTPPEELLRVMDRFAGIIPNLQITELDVDAQNDEQLQADYLRDVMIAAFSHPACSGIVIWGFWEKRHWRPAAALYRSDWTIKPAGQVWKDLVLHQWRTDSEGRTDSRGLSVLNCFMGEYELTAAWNDKKGSTRLSLPVEGASAKIVLE